MRAIGCIAWLIALVGCPGPRTMTVPDQHPSTPRHFEVHPAVVDEEESPSPATTPACVRTEPAGPGEPIALAGEIHFELEGAEIVPQSYPVLQTLAEALARETRFCRVDVTVHAMEPPVPQGQQLGRLRAQAVARFLVERGIDQARLHHVGFDDAQHREERRVEIVGHEDGCPCPP